MRIHGLELGGRERRYGSEASPRSPDSGPAPGPASNLSQRTGLNPTAHAGAPAQVPSRADLCYIEAMEGYYDHHPTALLARPLALTGFCGAGVEMVAHALCWRTGIPFFSSDRQLEHDLGSDLAVARMTFGDRAAGLERAVILRALERRPPPVIALGEGALVDAPTLERVTQAATLVYLEADPAELLRRIHAQRAQGPSRFLPTVPLDIADPAELAPLLAAREPGYRRAQHVLAIAGRHPHVLAAAILTLVGVEA